METLINPDGTAVEPQAGSVPGDLIKDTDTANFMADVVAVSQTVPVIVDFWAPWCGPCKQLTPVLEKLVTHAGGLVRLVKINVDENQELAAQMRVQSVPSVFGFKGGQPVDGFAGAQPESQIKAFIERLTGGARPPIDLMVEEAATALEQGALDHAHALYAEVLGMEGTNAAALGGLIRIAVAQGDLAGAREIADGIADELTAKPEIAGAIAALELEEAGGGGADDAELDALRAAVADDENDHQARFDLAMALFTAGHAEEAMDHLVDIIKRDRAWNEEAARHQLLKFFEALGPTHEHTVSGRRKLSAVLFS